MGNESGTWVMYGVNWDDPECIHTVSEAIEYINEVGFLPLFKNEIPGFSLEERTVPEYWWSENPEVDPWEWRAIIARSGEIAYGKFFNNKAGFISRKWLPYFVNYRRDGYDFDALWDDEKASRRQKKIMDLFTENNADADLVKAVQQLRDYINKFNQSIVVTSYTETSMVESDVMILVGKVSCDEFPYPADDKATFGIVSSDRYIREYRWLQASTIVYSRIQCKR